MRQPTDGRNGSAEEDDLVVVFRTADANLLALLQTVLEAAGIEFVVQGGGALGMLPLGPLATGVTRNLMAATLLVSADRAAEAIEILHPLAGESAR